MIWKKKVRIFSLLILILSAGTYIIYQSGVLPFFREDKESEARNPELLKMAKIIDQYKTENLEVIVDGYHRKPGEFLNFARQYLGRHFDPKMTAESWVKTYAYRSALGEIIYFQYPDGSTKPMRDVFLEALAKKEK